MAEPTVFEMEIEGVVHPVEDRTARQTVEKLTTYSTTEQDTGKTWVDGKPIYRKVSRFENQTGQVGGDRDVFAMNLGITADNLIGYGGCVEAVDSTSAGIKYALPMVSMSTNLDLQFASHCDIVQSTKAIVLYVFFQTGVAWFPTTINVDVWVEYTKI